MSTIIELTAVFTASICVVYAVLDGLRPLSTKEPSFFRSRTGMLRIEH